MVGTVLQRIFRNNEYPPPSPVMVIFQRETNQETLFICINLWRLPVVAMSEHMIILGLLVPTCSRSLQLDMGTGRISMDTPQTSCTLSAAKIKQRQQPNMNWMSGSLPSSAIGAFRKKGCSTNVNAIWGECSMSSTVFERTNEQNTYRAVVCLEGMRLKRQPLQCSNQSCSGIPTGTFGNSKAG